MSLVLVAQVASSAVQLLLLMIIALLVLILILVASFVFHIVIAIASGDSFVEPIFHRLNGGTIAKIASGLVRNIHQKFRFAVNPLAGFISPI